MPGIQCINSSNANYQCQHKTFGKVKQNKEKTPQNKTNKTPNKNPTFTPLDEQNPK